MDVKLATRFAWGIILAFALAATSVRLAPQTGAAALGQPAPVLGAHYDLAEENISFAVYSSRATRIELYLYEQMTGADEKLSVALGKDEKTNVWSVTLSVANL